MRHAVSLSRYRVAVFFAIGFTAFAPWLSIRSAGPMRSDPSPSPRGA